jgi:hypothetical protein
MGSLALQSFPSTIPQSSADTLGPHSGNAMGLKSGDGNRFIIEIAYIWLFAQDDTAVEELSQRVTDEIEISRDELVAQYIASRKGKSKRGDKRDKIETYNPHFLNDAMSDQDVLKSYARYEHFKNLQRSVDPDGYWNQHIGGFKY